MASKKLLHAKRATNSYIFVNPEAEINPLVSHGNLFEFDEADVWSSNSNNNNNNSRAVSQSEAKKMLPRKGGGRNNMVVTKTPVTCASSLPVNIPDWSKIYRVDHRGQSNNLDDQDSDYDILNHDDDAYDGRVPPHEYLARRRGASFSVHEGIGRTLKGRDLRQVRNAIWKQVGFED